MKCGENINIAYYPNKRNHINHRIMSRLFKEYKQYLNTPSENTQILQLAPNNPEDSIFEWTAIIAKKTSSDLPYYYNGKWVLNISCSPSYPMKPPVIKFSRNTPINHPNINFSTGEICLDILKDEHWSPAWNLQHLVIAILMLLDDPEPDSPLNVDLANLFRNDKTAFELLVQYDMWRCGCLLGGRDKTGERIEPSEITIG